MLHYKIVVSGRVQGVYFREFTQKSAKKHGIVGAVRNLEDGCVEVIATGDEKNMQLFLQDCHKGPVFSSVTQVDTTQLANTPYYSEFIILDI